MDQASSSISIFNFAGAMENLWMILSSKLILVFWLLLFSNNSLAQLSASALKKAKKISQEADSLSEIQEDTLALEKYLEAKTILLDNGLIGQRLIDICIGTGIIYQTDEKYERAIEAYKEAILYLKRINPVEDSSYFNAFLFIGSSFIDLNQFDSAYVYLGKAESSLTKNLEISQKLRLYNTIGYVFHLFGNYEQSINYFEKALATLNYGGNLAKQEDQYATIRYVMYNNNIAGSLRKSGFPRKAIEKTKGLIKFNIINNVVYQNIASSYLQLEHYDSSKIYLDKINSTDVSSNTRINPTREKITYFNTLGLVYSKTNKLTDALSCFNIAKQIIELGA